MRHGGVGTCKDEEMRVDADADADAEAATGHSRMGATDGNILLRGEDTLGTEAPQTTPSDRTAGRSGSGMRSTEAGGM